MTADNFDNCMPLLKQNEGGYQCLREDTGNWTGGAIGVGELRGTNWGISAASYPTVDIKALTWDQATAIYRRDYWTPAGCDDLPSGLDWAVMDAAVNSGVHAAIEWLQIATGATPDGVMGPKTRAAIASTAVAVAIGRFCDAREAHLRAHANWTRFGSVWGPRIQLVRSQALTMAQQPRFKAAAPQPTAPKAPAPSVGLWGSLLKRVGLG